MNSFAEPVLLGDKRVGDGNPIYIIADLGLTNGGDIRRAKSLIDIASNIGVDAVKFQMIMPEYLLGDRSYKWTYPTLNDGDKTENMFTMFSELSYVENEWKEIADYSRCKGLEFICTAHAIEAVPILERIGVSLHKICTWSCTHKRLVQEIGKTGKPIMLDTGGFTSNSLEELLDWHSKAGGRGAILLHDFHSSDHNQMNFRAIPYMKQRYGSPVGYTPQGRDYDMDYMSIGLGVNVLEKRLTIDRGIPKNGHFKSLEPDEFGIWLARVRDLESALGRFSVIPTSNDLEQSNDYFKSLYAKNDIHAGHLVNDADVAARRPGYGISASRIDDVCGRRAVNTIKAGQMIEWDDIS